MYGANVNCDVLKKYLELLIIRGLIEARLVGGEKTVYLITREGLALSKGWKELELSFPMIESESELQPLFRNSVSVKV
jgi:predicted transcriptional regulator